MEKHFCINGKAIPLAMNDVDTDLIIPAQYLIDSGKEGYGKYIFRRLRDQDKDFVFNQEIYNDASILIAGENFGCGSSREHAVWALLESGIKAIIAPSFADIFSNNAAKNSLILIKLDPETVNAMLNKAKEDHYELLIDFTLQTVTNDSEKYNFEYDPFRKYCIIQQLDDIDYILSFKEKITSYRSKNESFNYINKQPSFNKQE